MKSDSELVHAAVAGDAAAFGELTVKYRTAILALAYRWTHNVGDAQDLTQETFIQAFLKLSQLKESASFAIWLRAISQNLCLAFLRSGRRQVSSADELADFPSDSGWRPDRVVETEEARRTAVDLLDMLSDRSAVAARLYYVDGFSQKEVSDLLDVSLSTVEGRLQRARDRLRDAVGSPVRESRMKQAILRLTTFQEGGVAMDAIRVEIGMELVPFVHSDDQNLMTAIGDLRKSLEENDQIVLPPVRVRDNVELPLLGFTILFHEASIITEEADDRSGAVCFLTDRLRSTVLENRAEFGR
ncbi:MAG: sigma-70 family RNA polymerase sigma factor [Gemmatimonadetes bacterium]|jgi:RNA polymerase sigma factor (sigma-70 family)|nr:sigma-70 family RNA polymerase sigma factor [Gemmatimonadota bacterium]